MISGYGEKFIKTSNSWLLKLNTHDISLQELVQEYGSTKLENVLEQIYEASYKLHKTSNKNNFSTLLDELKKARKSYFKQQKIVSKSTLKSKTWLNPTAAG